MTGTGTSSPGSGPNSVVSLSTSLTSGGHIHRTAAAIERVNKLWCYACDTMDDGPACVDVLERNSTALMKKCQGEEFICMVRAVAYQQDFSNLLLFK